MPQPYNYLPGQPPAQAFLQGLQASQALRQQQEQQNRRQQMTQALAGLQTSPSPEGFAEFYLKYPEMREQVEAYRTSLADADKNTLLGAAREALTLRRAGRSEEVGPLFERYAEAASNSNRPDMAQQFRDAQRVYGIDPDKTGDFALRMMFENLDPDGYKQFFGNESSTTFQKDFDFIRETYGDDAASEFAQYGRGGVVSIPLGNGQTYVGPPSLAPGASRWRAPGGQTPGGEPSGGGTPGEGSPVAAGEAGIPEILHRASDTKHITAAEVGVIQRSLGPNGTAKFQEWLRDKKIKVIVRTGTAADGRRVVQFEDGTVEYAP